MILFLKKNRVILLFFTLLFLASFWAFSSHFRALVSSPSSYINLHYSELFANENRLFSHNALGEKYDTVAFGRRGDLYFEKDAQYAPASFFGLPIYLGILRKFSDSLLFISIPLLFLGASIYFFRLARHFFSEETAILGTLVFSLSHPVFLIGNILENNIFATLCFLGVCFHWYAFVFEKQKTNDLFWLSFWLGIGLWVRLDFAVFPILLFLLFWRENFEILKKMSAQQWFLGTGVFGIFFIGYFLFDFWTYGKILGYFSPDKSINFNPYFEEKIESEDGLFVLWNFLGEGNPLLLIQNFFWHIFLSAPIIIGFGLLGIFFFRKKTKEKHIQKFILLFFLAVFFFARHQWSSSFLNEITVLTPEMRYVLPAFFAPVFALLLFWEKWKISEKIKGFFLLLFVTFHFLIALFEPFGIQDLAWKNNFEIPQIKRSLLQSPENSIFLTQRLDKYIFPERNSFLYPNEEKSCEIAHKMLDEHIPLFLMNEEGASDFLKECNLQSTFENGIFLYSRIFQ